MSCPPTCSFSFSQLAAVGHDGSDGRTRRTVELAKVARVNVGRYRKTEEMSGIAARPLRKLLLFIVGRYSLDQSENNYGFMVGDLERLSRA
jgi:hypothetical protein